MRQTGHGQSNNVIGNVAPIVLNMAYKDRMAFPDMPFYVGNNAFPERVIAYRNGILDVDAFLYGNTVLMPHTPKWVSTFCLPYNFSPEAGCPQWLKFLDQVFGDDRITLLQQWFGYCLLPDNSRHVFMHLQGPPGSGKSTIAGVLEQVVGSDYTTGFSLHSLAESHGTELLVGKLLAICGETNLVACRDKYRVLEEWNKLTGYDPVRINPKHKAPYSCKLPARFLIISNEDVNFVDHSGAVARRLLCLPFDKSFDKVKDVDLPRKLAGEIEGIAYWALQGLVSLQRDDKFHEPERSQQRKNEQRRSNSDVFAFLQDKCCVHRACDPGNLDGVQIVDQDVSVTREALWNAWIRWWTDQGKEDGQRPTQSVVGINLKAILPRLKDDRRRIDGKITRLYVGIGLRDREEGKPITDEEKLARILG